jgi:hypothetical protein
MTTRRSNIVVSSLIFTLTMTSGLTGCAGGPAPVTQAGVMEASTAPDARVTMRFDNEADMPVDVYLVTGQLQWRLGRVAPGARTMLRIPEATLDPTAAFMRLIVLPGTTASAQAARDPRAVFAIAQPVREIVAQRWTFRNPRAAAGQLLGERR